MSQFLYEVIAIILLVEPIVDQNDCKNANESSNINEYMSCDVKVNKMLLLKRYLLMGH